MLPVCYQQHWFLFAATMPTKTTSIPNHTRKEKFSRHWNNFMTVRKDPSMWTVGEGQSSQQEADDSCGIFVLMDATALLKGYPPSMMKNSTPGATRGALKRVN